MSTTKSKVHLEDGSIWTYRVGKWHVYLHEPGGNRYAVESWVLTGQSERHYRAQREGQPYFGQWSVQPAAAMAWALRCREGMEDVARPFQVWLDDERPAPPGWIRCRTPGEAIAHVAAGCDELSLDHDLGEGQGTGYDVVCWIEQKVRGLLEDAPGAATRYAIREWLPRFSVHSANPVGRRNMEVAIAAIARSLDQSDGPRKIQRDLSTPENRDFWKPSPRADEIDGWPAWKRSGVNATDRRLPTGDDND